MGIKHPFTSSKTDQSDSTKVRPSIWNSDHIIDSDVDFAGNSATNVGVVTAVTVNTTDAVIATTVNATEVIVADEAYNQSAWDGELSVPTKNAIRDKIEALVLSGGGVTDFLGLDDTPDAYPGQAGKSVQVNALETALEFGATGVTPRGPTLTISGGAITVTHSFHYVDTEGLAAVDNLDTISGGTDGQRLTLVAANEERHVFLRSGVGNISCGDGGFDLISGGYIGQFDGEPVNTIDLIYDATQSIWLEQSRYGGRGYFFKNVRDYGATGDGTTDDTAAIQAAIADFGPPSRYTFLRRGTIYFPVGVYKTTSEITFPKGLAGIEFLGSGGVEINANFNGYIFTSTVTGGVSYSAISFKNLLLRNSNTTNTTSGCLHVAECIGVKIQNCRIIGGGGIGVYVNNSQQVTVDACVFLNESGNVTNGSIGFMTENASISLNCDYVGWDHAIRSNNVGLNVIGGRLETNNVGIFLGQGPTGTNSTQLGTTISACSMESNNIHILLSNSAHTTIQGVYMTSFNPVGMANTRGIYVRGAANTTIQNCNVGALGYSIAGIVVELADITKRHSRLTIRNTTSTSWLVDDRVETTTWSNTNYPGAWTNNYNEEYSDPSTIPDTETYRVVPATIASGVITVEANYMKIDTEGAAATDDLVTIDGAVVGNCGSRLVLRALSSARTVVVKDGTGNLRLAGDCTLDNEQDTITLIWDSDLSVWLELGRSDNGA